MATLTQSVAIGDTELHVNTAFADGSFPGYVKIDSEMLSVGGAEWRTGTTLVLSKPATATHSSGATVTYAGNPFDADFLSATSGGGSGVTVDNQSDPPAEVTTLVMPGAVIAGDEADLSGRLQMRLLGPAHIAHDDAGLLTSNGIAVLVVPPNALVLRAFMIVTEDWDDPTSGISIGIGTDDEIGTSNWKIITTYQNDMYTSGLAYFHELPPLAPTMVGLPGPTGGRVFVNGGGTFLTGEADIYALIAEPAA